METIKKDGLSRRTVMKGAAWSVPVIAAAVAVPMAAASGVPGNDGNYFWRGESQEEWTTLTYSTWSGQTDQTSPVSGASLSVTITFNEEVTLTAVPSDWSGPVAGTTGRTFTFTQATGRWGHNFDIGYTYAESLVGKTLTSDAAMRIVPSGATTWSGVIAHAEVVLPKH